MKDGIEPDMAYQRLHRTLVTDIDLEESCSCRNGFSVSRREVIYNRDGMPFSQQFSATD
jgi:hypothetical protein